MLLTLQIENYAIIRSLHISFDTGFTVITGETGAGKSILLGALSLILGNRADTTVLYDSSKKCYVEGSFDIKHLHLEHFFSVNDIDYQDVTVLRREIAETGKSRAFINDTPVNLTVLRDLAVQLVDIHSQHQHLLFREQDFRLLVLDQYAKQRENVIEYRRQLEQLNRLEKTLCQCKEEEKQMALEQEFITYQLNEFVEAQLVAGEQEELENKINFLSHAELIKSKLYTANMLISEQDNNLLSGLNEVKNSCQSVATFDEQIKQWEQRLESLIIELSDIDYEINIKEKTIEYHPEELLALKERLDLIFRLQQKHRVQTVEALLDKKQALEKQLETYHHNQSQIEKLEKEYQHLYTQLFDRAALLSKRRKEVVPQFEQEMQDKLTHLSMADGLWKVKIEAGNQLMPEGIDTVKFLFSANKGVDLMEVDKIASGGELSRLMLAVKSIITSNSFLPTVIFDEIDTGISGEIAGKVAQLMRAMAQTRQLLVITHLPQIAAKATLHYQVYKEEIQGKTYTNVKQLNEKDRVEEIAKMISGVSYGEAARMTAKELLTK